MYYKNSSIPEAFILALQLELEKQSEGISEYNLMKRLKNQGYFDFLSEPSLPHELFHAHFFLFHSLYQLHDVYLEKKQHILNIHTLSIQLLPYMKGKNNLQEVDKLREYYLDFSHLEKTSEDDVYEMLASFWNKYNNIDNREAALADLGLIDPVDSKTIKEKYRKLVMQYHPDRGGDNEKLQNINEAINILLG